MSWLTSLPLVALLVLACVAPALAGATLKVRTDLRANLFLDKKLVATGYGAVLELDPGTYVLGVVDEVNRVPIEVRVTAPAGEHVERVVTLDAELRVGVTSFQPGRGVVSSAGNGVITEVVPVYVVPPGQRTIVVRRPPPVVFIERHRGWGRGRWR